MEPSEQKPPAIRMKYSKDADEFTVLASRDVEAALGRELRAAGVVPLYSLRETAAVAEVILLTIGGISSVITIANAIRDAVGSEPGKRIIIKVGDREIDASNYSARQVAKLLEKAKE